ncbi:MAG TPA: peptidylprolyl isomerase, partial [Rhodothermales bacterium]|nr:peptidylprolyl isomerase [Rhodothermales bacterium]
GYVRARHILISAAQTDTAAVRQARARLNDVRQRIEQGASFEVLARETSQDPASAAQGGDLGWFSRDQMVAPFAEAAFGAAPGSIVGPVQTEYGLHLIQVLGKATQDVQVAIYGTRLRAESSTLRRAEDQLEDFRFEVEQGNDSTSAEARRLGLNHEEYEYADGQFVYPGVGRSGAVRRFLDRADDGDVSPVIELDERFVVLVVRDVTPEGVRPLEEVRDQATQLARNEKRKQIVVNRLRRELARGFDGLAQRVMGQAVTASLSGEAFDVSGFGPQPRLAGALFVTPQGRMTPVIEGVEAAFVARATQVSNVGQIPASEREAITQRLLNQKRQVIGARFRAALREAAEVEDNRAEYLSE